MQYRFAHAAAVLAGLMATRSFADTVVFNFDNVTGATTPTVKTAPPSSGSPANLAVGSFTGGSTVANGVYSNSSSTGAYTGASGLNNFGEYVAPAGGSSYYSVTFTPTAGFAVELDSLNFGIRSTSTGPTAYAIETSLNNYGSSVASGTITANSTYTLKSNTFTPVTSLVSTPLTVEIVVSGGVGATGSAANNRIDDVTFGVEAVAAGITAVPVPKSFAGAAALLGVVGLGRLRRPSMI